MEKAPATDSKLLGRFRFRRRNLIAFAYAFGAALTFWVFNALGNRYDAYLEYPVDIQYDKNQFVPTDKVATSVKVAVNGTGWSILRHQFERIPPLTVVVSDSLMLSEPLSWDYFLPQVREKLHAVTVSEFQQRTLVLPVEPLMQKRIILFVAAKGADQNAVCLPPVVEVSGAASRVKAFADTLHVHVSESNPSAGYAEKIRLKTNVSGLSLNPSQVIVSFNAIQTDTLLPATDILKTP